VDSIAISATTYADSKTDTQLGEMLADVTYNPPPDNLTGLVSMGNGILAGFAGKDFYVSVAYKPWAWPVAYRHSIPHAIVALISLGNTAVLCTEGGPWLATGTDPASIIPTPTPSTAACVSKQSAVSCETYGLFAAADGVYLVNEGGCKRITGDHYDRKAWNELYPTTLHGVIHDGKYWAWYSSGGTEGGIVLDLATGELSTLDFYTDAAFTDPQTDKLYFIVSEFLLDEEGNYILDEDGYKIRIE
jgi:hypothetical protein